MKTTQLHTLQKYLDEVNKKVSEINDEIHSMDVALDSNDMSKVFQVMSNAEKYKKQKLIFSQNDDFVPAVLILNGNTKVKVEAKIKGKGKYVWKDGRVYDGEWKDGK